MHVVIVDGGRSSILGTGYQEILHCIRCGACQNVCPVYRQVGGHAYGWVYGGPDRRGADAAVQAHGRRAWRSRTRPACAPRATTSARSRSRSTTCCSACGATAQSAASRASWNALPTRAWSYAWSRPFVYRLSGPVGLGPLRLIARSGVLHRAPGFLGRWTRGRDLLLPWRKR